MGAQDPIDAIIAVRDGARYLAEAIESVLSQTLPPSRLIVVDDGSSDESAAIAESCGGLVTVLRLPPRGTPAALNAALAESSAPLVGFLDADDVWLADKLELQAALLAERTEVETVYGHVVEFLDDAPPGLVARAEPTPGFVKSALLARRSAFDRVGGFDDSYAVVDFPEWHARCRDAGIVEHMLPAVVARRRVHGANVTVRRRGIAHAEYLRLARATLARRRAAASQP
jgi:glycosyltransferase involved in cell wall biosynthesis